MGKAIKSPLDKYFNPNSNKYSFVPLDEKFPFIYVNRENLLPSLLGGVTGEGVNRFIQYNSNQIVGDKNEKNMD